MSDSPAAAAPAPIPAVEAPYRVRRHEWLHVLRSALRTPRGIVGATLTLLVVGVAVIGPFVAPHGSTEFVTTPFAKPGGDALLGGDGLARDVLSRVLDGGWKLLLMALAATALGIARTRSRKRARSRSSASWRSASRVRARRSVS